MRRQARIFALLVGAACSSESRAVPQARATPGAERIAAAAKPRIAASAAAVTQLAVGASHSCALHADGTVSCWGSNSHGQLGIENLARSVQPIAVPGVTGATAVSAADDLSCVLRADRSVECWGHLGLASQLAKPSSIAVSDVVELAGRCFRTSAGRVECLNANAQLVAIEGVVGASQISAYSSRGCALLDSGKVRCWVDETSHEVSGLATVANVVSDYAGGCALLSDGAVKCWTFIEIDAKIGTAYAVASNATEVVGGGDSLCVRLNGEPGAMQCWKDRNAHSKKTTFELPPGAPIAVGMHTCFARGERDVSCFGVGTEGQLGNGWWSKRPVPTRVPNLDNVVQLVGANHRFATCARTTTNDVACWGMFSFAPQPVPRGMGITNVRELVDSETLRYIDTKGRLHVSDYYSAWREEASASFAVRETGVVTAGGHCVIKAGGRLRCANLYYPEKYADTPKLGKVVAVKSYPDVGVACARDDGNRLTCFRPGSKLEIKALDDVVDFDVTDTASCIVRSDRSLACWGSMQSDLFANKAGEEVPLTPVPVGPVVALSMVRNNSCIVRSTGAVACWGANTEGQLGDGTFLPRDRPVDVIGIDDAIDVHLGHGYACALHRAGHVSCWGTADRGQVGTYAMVAVETPSAVVWP